MSRVTIVKTGDDFDATVAKAIDDIGYPIVAPGDSVLIKPNLVEPRAPDSGVITNPGIIEAVARYCLDQGAGRDPFPRYLLRCLGLLYNFLLE